MCKLIRTMLVLIFVYNRNCAGRHLSWAAPALGDPYFSMLYLGSNWVFLVSLLNVRVSLKTGSTVNTYPGAIKCR